MTDFSTEGTGEGTGFYSDSLGVNVRKNLDGQTIDVILLSNIGITPAQAREFAAALVISAAAVEAGISVPAAMREPIIQ